MLQYYLVCGLENGHVPLAVKFTNLEILTNSGEHKDTEIMYTLRELEGDMYADMPLFLPKSIRLNRDVENSIGVISRVDQKTYEKFEEIIGY